MSTEARPVYRYGDFPELFWDVKPDAVVDGTNPAVIARLLEHAPPETIWKIGACDGSHAPRFVPSRDRDPRSAGRDAGHVPCRVDSSVAPLALGADECRQALPRNDSFATGRYRFRPSNEARYSCTEAAVQSAQADFV